MKKRDGKKQKGKGLDWAKGISQSRSLVKLKEIISISHQRICLFTITTLKYTILPRLMTRPHPPYLRQYH